MKSHKFFLFIVFLTIQSKELSKEPYQLLNSQFDQPSHRKFTPISATVLLGKPEVHNNIDVPVELKPLLSTVIQGNQSENPKINNKVKPSIPAKRKSEEESNYHNFASALTSIPSGFARGIVTGAISKEEEPKHRDKIKSDSSQIVVKNSTLKGGKLRGQPITSNVASSTVLNVSIGIIAISWLIF